MNCVVEHSSRTPTAVGTDDSTSGGVGMAGKNKGGREARKPKQDQNKKSKGQTPAPRVPEPAPKALRPSGPK